MKNLIYRVMIPAFLAGLMAPIVMRSVPETWKGFVYVACGITAIIILCLHFYFMAGEK